MSRGETIAGGCGLLVLALVAAGLTYAGWQGLAAHLEQRGWLETSCEIEASWVTGPFPGSGGPVQAEAPQDWGAETGEDEGPESEFRFRALYRYEPPVDAPVEPRRGTVLADDYDGSEAAEAYRLRDTYEPGSYHLCWVDPDDPGRAVLRRRGAGLSMGLLLAGATLLLVLVVAGRLLLGNRRRRHLTGTSVPVSSSGKYRFPVRAAFALFFLLFLLFGIGFAVPIGGEAVRAVGAGSWEATDCEILSSRVESHEGDDGTTYSVEMVYAYRWDGRSYHGDRYDFVSGSSSGYRGKAEVVERFPPGTVTECRVDPDEPWESVVDPSMFPGVLLVLLPLIFVAVGVVGLFFVGLSYAGRDGSPRGWAGRRGPNRGAASASPSPRESFDPGLPVGASRRSRRAALRARREAVAALPSAIDPVGPVGPVESAMDGFEVRVDPSGARVLEPQSSPRTKLLLAVVFALFWNGITWVGIWAASSDGGLDGCLTIFLGLFALIGLGLALAVPYQFLALFNPRPRLVLDGPLHPGARPTVHWSFSGKPQRIRGLTLTLTGHEHATYRRGTDTHTARSEFARIPVLETSQTPEIARGSREIPIPADAVPSFKAPRNVVEWRLDLRGDVPRWPDVLTTFPLPIESAPCPPAEPGDEPRPVYLTLREGGASAPGETVPVGVEPGETIEVVAAWELPVTAREERLESLEVRLTWATSGRGDTDRETVLRIPVLGGNRRRGGDDAPAPLPGHGEERVELTVPGSPCSFSGELISVDWVLELVAGFETLGESAAAVELIVGPGGREVHLPKPATEESS